MKVDNLKRTSKVGGVLALIAALGLQACGGGSSSSPAASSAGEVPISFAKRAGVTTYAGSTVEIEYYDSTNGWQAMLDLGTSDSGALSEMGLFDLSDISFLSDTWYRFTVTGGNNVDTDSDGVIDETGAAVNGRLRSLARGDWLAQQGGSHISAATEFAYTSLHKLLVADEIDWVAVEDGLNTAAEKLLVEDQTGDGEVTAEDLLAQDPQSLYDNLYFYQRNQLASLNELISAGLSSQLTGRLNEWAMGTGEQGVYEMVLDSEGRMAYAAVSRDGVLIYDATTGAETFVKPNISITKDLALSENRELLFVAGGSGGVEVIDLATQTLIDPLLSSYGYVYDMLVSADETMLYVATGDGFLVYDIDAGTYQEFLTGACQRLTFSEGGSRIGLGCFAGMQVYDVASGTITHDIELASAAYTVLLEGDAAYVANEGEGLTIVDLPSGDYISYPTPNNQWLLAIAPYAQDNTLAIFPQEGSYTFDLALLAYGAELFPDIENYSADYVYYAAQSDIYFFDYDGFAAGVLKTADIVEVIDDANFIFNAAFGASGDKLYYSDYYGDFDVYDLESGVTETYALPGEIITFAVNEAETLAYVMWRNNGFYVLDLTDGSYEAVSLGKKFANPVLDETAGRLYLENYGENQVEVFSTADNSLVEVMDLGNCDTTFLRLSEVEHALDVACSKNGVKRMNLDTGNWTQILDSNYLYSFDYNADESLMYYRDGSNLVIRDMATDTAIQTISYTGDDSGMVVYTTFYWSEMNAVILGGNQGARFVSLDAEKQYWLHREFGNSFAVDKLNRHVYLAAANDAGLLLLDMSDFE